MRYNPILHGHAAAWDDERKHYKGKGGSAPKTPNYEKLAVQQAELDRQAAERNVLANRANQNTPWGSLSWTQNKNPVTVDQAGYDAMLGNYNTYNTAKPIRQAGQSKAAYKAAVNAWQTARNAAQSALQSGGFWNGGSGTSAGSPMMVKNPQTGMILPAGPSNYGLTNGGAGSSSGGKLRAPTLADFTKGGDNTGTWTQDITLNPEDQARLTAQQKSQRALAEGAQGMLGRVNDAYSKEFNWADAPKIRELNLSNLPGVRQLDPSKLHGVREVDLGKLPGVWDADWTKANPETGGMAIDTVKNALMSRIAPDLLRNREREEAQMIAQGVGRGANEAWNKSQTTLGRNENDAAMQALLSGIGEYGNIRGGQMDWRNQVLGEQTGQFERDVDLRNQGWGEQKDMFNADTDWRNQNYGELTDQYNRDILDRDRYIKEQKAQRDLPMDEYERLMQASGNVTMPNFPGYANMGAPNAANLTGAAQDTYNSNMQKYNAGQQASGNFWNTASSLASTGAALYL